MRRNMDMRGRIKELQDASATASVMTAAERRERLTRMTRVNMASFDMERDGDLVQEIIYHEDGVTPKKIKLPGKRECIMADAELAGEIPKHGVEVHHTGTIEHKHTITDERRQVLIEKRRAATARLDVAGAN